MVFWRSALDYRRNDERKSQMISCFWTYFPSIHPKGVFLTQEYYGLAHWPDALCNRTCSLSPPLAYLLGDDTERTDSNRIYMSTPLSTTRQPGDDTRSPPNYLSKLNQVSEERCFQWHRWVSGEGKHAQTAGLLVNFTMRSMNWLRFPRTVDTNKSYHKKRSNIGHYVR